IKNGYLIKMPNHPITQHHSAERLDHSDLLALQLCSLVSGHPPPHPLDVLISPNWANKKDPPSPKDESMWESKEDTHVNAEDYRHLNY
uniref:hypothetical protein n=1 Tax=Methanobrevibacter sp. TaxID=66852 RepID=UPI00388DBA8D